MSAYFDRYFRKHGLRRVRQLATPPIQNFEDIHLPRGSILHYLAETSVDKGIPTDHWAVKTADRLVVSDHVEELGKSAQEGNPRPTTIKARQEIQKYHRRHRKIKRVRNLETNAKDERTLIVVNYALLPDLYRYTKSFYSAYYAQRNIFSTLVENLQAYGKKLRDRQHFIPVELPDRLPSLQELRRVEENLTQSYVEDFQDQESLFLLELWRWLGEHRKNSIFSPLDKETLNRTNLIFQHDNHWLLVNLGCLDLWREAVEGEDEGQIKPDAIQKRFLRALHSLRAAGGEVEAEQDKDSEPQKEKEPEPEADEAPETQEDVRSAVQELDEAELEAELDAVQPPQTEEEPESIEGLFEGEPLDVGEGVEKRAAALAEQGILTGPEYKRYKELSEKQKELPNPFTGKGKLTEFSTITEEDLDISEGEQYPDNDSVVDKSMLQSTLNRFDQQYVEKVLPKDVANSVMAVNQAGVGITDYDVEIKEDVANKYEIHTVRLNPVGGKPSTVRFRIPSVDENGNFMANGITYRMRKQRGDLPIRKVRPDRVALTSYYGKVFVERSGKVVENYGLWLTKQIRKIGLDSEDNRVTHLRSAKSVEETMKLPRLAATLGMEFNSFQAGDVEFYFVHDKRKEHFGADWVEKNEVDGTVVIGRRGNQGIVVDDNDTLYTAVDGKLEVLGRIEGLLGLDRSKAPVEVANLKVFSKSVPMGIVLAYYFGLDRLIAGLEGSVRRVPEGQRVSLSEEEYAIRFRDETLVASREDRLTSLIMGSFNAYKKSLRTYDVNDLNSRDVFFNILDDNGLGLYHLNEMDLLDEMFVDPITRELLEQLEEPQNWRGLLKRACELLLTEYAPKETDLSQMRIKGYERISGAVYGEMVNSLREHRSKPQGKNAAIEMNPFSVWEKLTSADPAVVLVEESNPIQNLKEKEALTFMGQGGRSKATMVARTRAYGENDMGVVSEATVDSGDVGINTSLVPNPKLASVRGLANRYDPESDGSARLLSTSALLSPGADTDDPKRVKS